jgi:hypothetical protein
MSDGSAQEYGQGALSETNRQSHAVSDWVGSPPGQSYPDGDDDTDDLGSYAAISLPPNPGLRAADVWSARQSHESTSVPSQGPPDTFNFPGVGMGSRQGGGGGMYGSVVG